MNMIFADTLKKPRTDKGLSQQALAEKMFVTKSAVSRWENGSRLPDAAMMSRLAEILGVDVYVLLNASAQSDEHPNVIMVDDNKIIVNGSLPIIEQVIPNASVTGFIDPSEAVEYAKANRVSLAFLDIEMGTIISLVLLVRSHQGRRVKDHLSAGRSVPCDADIHAYALSSALQRRKNRQQRAVPARNSGSRHILHHDGSHSVHRRLLLRYAGQSVFPRSVLGVFRDAACRVHDPQHNGLVLQDQKTAETVFYRSSDLFAVYDHGPPYPYVL
ncbi:MAG: helix-turn-helix domain-containing protein [Ruminococcus sp.]|nr:helix-turn-helix domain-containing protein [Ruminococcus sp.]